MVHSVKDREWLVIGSQGFLGRHFCRALPGATALNRQHLDLVDPKLPVWLGEFRFAILAAGMSNPRKCAEHPALSKQCNVEGTLKLGKELLKRGVIPIFFSSDYVFNDKLQISPLNLYGEQKKELEERTTGWDCLVIRLGKVYGVEKGDGTLFDEMAAQLIHGKSVRAAYDQMFSPIYVEDVVRHVIKLALQGIRGVVTLVGPSFASRLEMALHLAKALGVSYRWVQPISLDDLHDGIRRPKMLTLEGVYPALRWEEGIDRVVKTYER